MVREQMPDKASQNLSDLGQYKRGRGNVANRDMQDKRKRQGPVGPVTEMCGASRAVYLMVWS